MMSEQLAAQLHDRALLVRELLLRGGLLAQGAQWLRQGRRIVVGAARAPAVDITTKDGTKVFSNVAFGKSVDFTPLPAGTYDLQARVAGTDNVALDLPGVNLPDGAILTVVAEGFAGGGTPKLGVQVISYPAMSAAPSALPVTGGETAANNGWLLLVAGALKWTDAAGAFFGGATALLPAFAKDILKAGPDGLGWLRSAMSNGAVVQLS